MSRVVELLCSRRAPQMAALALMSVGMSACSADMQTRLSQNPFAPETTGSVAPRAQAPAATPELPQYARPRTPNYQYEAQPLPPPVSAPQSYPSSSAGGVSGGGRGLSSYAPPSQGPIESTGTVAPRSIAAARPVPHFGGTKIIVGTSDTLDILAKRYNVSAADIMQANGLRGPRALQPGQQIVIPQRASAVPPLAAPATTKPAAVAAAPAPIAAPSVHVVNRGDTLASIARANRVSVGDLARANGLTPASPLKIGSRISVPGARTAEAPAAPASPVAAAAPPAVPAPASVQPAPIKMAAAAPAEPVQKVRMASATATPEPAAAANEPATKAAEATGALPTFRWPVRGRVIAGFGAKTNGKQNDGINVAVPEGTPIKAAEDGVVAYAGNELKGYGNLVLVRHSNGYVTAYAHASELTVKRGETIKRGQLLGKSGQSGEASSPQLHFEIRKGSSPVDPLQFLNGA